MRRRARSFCPRSGRSHRGRSCRSGNSGPSRRGTARDDTDAGEQCSDHEGNPLDGRHRIVRVTSAQIQGNVHGKPRGGRADRVTLPGRAAAQEPNRWQASAAYTFLHDNDTSDTFNFPADGPSRARSSIAGCRLPAMSTVSTRPFLHRRRRAPHFARIHDRGSRVSQAGTIH